MIYFHVVIIWIVLGYLVSFCLLSHCNPLFTYQRIGAGHKPAGRGKRLAILLSFMCMRLSGSGMLQHYLPLGVCMWSEWILATKTRNGLCYAIKGGRRWALKKCREMMYVIWETTAMHHLTVMWCRFWIVAVCNFVCTHPAVLGSLHYQKESKQGTVGVILKVNKTLPRWIEIFVSMR